LAASSGGGSPTVSNCVFAENDTLATESFAVEDSASGILGLQFSNCTFADNLGGALDVDYGNAPITNCRFLRNCKASVFTSPALLLFGSPYREIIGCSFVNNRGPGVWAMESTRFINCRFIGNSTTGTGGGIHMFDGSATVINCLFSGNHAGDGGAFSGSGLGTDRFTNCTVVGNSATRWVGGISGTVVLKNCILWGNTDEYGSTYYSQVAALRADYSIIQGWDGSRPGTATTSLDPLLMDPLGPDGIAGTEDDDLRLSPGSPAINAGDPNPSGLPTTDLDGHARVLCGRADIGAYEFGIGDFNCDYRVNLLDSVQFAGCMSGPNGAELRITNYQLLMANGESRMSKIPAAPGANESDVASSIDNRQSAIDTPCAAFDFDGDGDIDLSDFAAFSRVLRRLETFDGVKPRAQP